MADETFKFSVKVKGWDEELKPFLQELAQKLPEKADRVVEDGGEQIFGLSQQIVPVLTGRLQLSGSHNHTFLRSEIGYNTDYALFVEEGTSKMSPQPYLRPAVETYVPSIIEKLKELAE